MDRYPPLEKISPQEKKQYALAASFMVATLVTIALVMSTGGEQEPSQNPPAPHHNLLPSVHNIQK